MKTKTYGPAHYYRLVKAELKTCENIDTQIAANKTLIANYDEADMLTIKKWHYEMAQEFYNDYKNVGGKRTIEF